MKSKHLLLTLLMALLVPWAASAQETVTIGDLENAGNDSYLPMNSLYEYSYSQQIYTAEEIGMAGTINSITVWLYGNANLYEMPFDIYMVETDKENFESTSDWISVTSGDIVYSGSVTVHNTTAEAYTFELATPFEYSGEGNLVIAFDNNTGSWKSGLNGKVFTATDNVNRAIYARRDSNDYDPTNMSGITATSIVAKRNVIEINITGGGGATCEKPETLTAVQPDVNPYHGVLLQWEGGSGTYTVQMKKSSDEEWATKATGFTDYALLINGLDAETTYNLRVQSECGDEMSAWKTVNYTTPIACPVPTQVTVSDITPYSAVVSWTSEAESFNLKLGETVIEHCTSPYTLSNLTPETSYTVKVQAVCSDIDQSQWTSGTSFMTAEICPEGMVCIGTGTATNGYIPTYTYYNYSLTQQIYTAAEIGEAGAILSVAFRKVGTNGGTRDLNIYMVSTTKDAFSDGTDWITVTASDLVYSGSVTFNNDAWTTIEFDNPFIYDGRNNVALIVDDNTGSYVSAPSFYAFDATSQAIRVYSDGTNYDPYAPTSYNGTVLNQKNRIRLNIGEPPACPKPTGVTASDVTAHEATISWTSDASAWQIQLGEETAIDVTEPTYTFTRLAPETTFAVKVRANCGGVYSEWTAPVSFTTGIACPAPTGLTATLTPGNGSVATLSWTSDASAWVVAYKVSTDTVFTEVPVTENPYTLTGLTPETAYTVKVKAVCGGEDGESQWSSTITFTPTNAYMLTVNNGTNTNGYVPVYGFYVDNYSYSQFIIPATNLTPMQWGTINELTFYSSDANIGWSGAKFEVYMTETTETTLSALADWTTMDKVMNEAHLEISGNQMVVTLDAPYDYMGGNLMVGIKQTVSGSYGSASFYGITATGASMGGYGSSVSQQNFLPKTTFAYEPGEAPACPKPTGLAVNYINGITATVTWESDATSYNIDVNGTVTEGVTSPYTLEGLELATTYNVMVQAVCSAEELSEWTAPVSFTTDLCLPENMCAITIALNDSYGDGWNGGQLSVVDVLTEDVLGTYTIGSGDSETYTLALCEGRTINIVYTAGSYPYENGWVVTDINDEVISEHISGSSSNPPTTGIQATYTVNCTVITCKKPKNLVASDIDKTSVVLSWTPGTEDQSAWRIAYMSENDSIYSYKNVTTHPYTLNGLTPETTYTVKVQANCGDGDYSDWSNEISFTTADACPMTTIEYLTPTNITTTQAMLNWISTYESYEVHYKKVYGETEWSEILSTNSSSIALSGLDSGTEYEYQVRGYCADVDAYTDWVDGINFTTASICGAPENLYVVPSTESATLTWTGYQDSYTVTCNGNVTNNVYGTTFNIIGLQPSTTYTATVTGEGDCLEFETASIEFTTGTDWTNGSAWVGGEAPEQGGVGTVADSTIVVIPGDAGTVTFDSLAVGEGSYIVIEPGVELIFGGDEPIPVVISFDDDEDIIPGAKCREEQLPGGYKLIAPPTFLSNSELYLPVDTTHLMDNYYENDLYSFDVNYPAAEWRNYKLAANNFVNLNWKQGYLYYYQTATGTWPGYAVPTQNATQEIALDYNASHAYFPGANLIGNPFIVKGYPNKEFYVLNSDGNEVISATNNYVKAGKGFFVLASAPGETCTVYTEAPVTLQSLNIALSQDCSLIDAAAIRFNDTKGLAKFQLNPNHTKIYMPFEGKDYAILQGEGLGEMPLNFEAEENGTYMLSFKSHEVEFSYLHLIDNLTGVETNLLNNPSYTFNAQVTDYASRFRLVYATGSSINGDNFGFINGMGNLCIFGIEGEATVQVIDVLGHVISSDSFSGSYEQKLNVAPGVYMIRLINGNDVKVQKIIVR